MCAHYDPQTDPARLKSFFGVSDGALDLKSSLWPGHFGPFLRKHEFADVGDNAMPLRELLLGSFGLIPHWAKDATIARNTYNARSETVHEKPSYRDAWHQAQHCIIPAEAFYEPDWRSGRAVPTRITRADGKPMGIAGLWASKRHPSGDITHSYGSMPPRFHHGTSGTAQVPHRLINESRLENHALAEALLFALAPKEDPFA